MQVTLTLSLRPDVKLGETSTDEIQVLAQQTRLSLKQVSTAMLKAFGGLTRGEATEEDLAVALAEADGMPGLMKWSKFLEKLTQRSLLCRTLRLDNRSLATLVPLSEFHRWVDTQPDAEQVYALSRFAFTRREDDTLVLECPLGHAKLRIENPRVLSVLDAWTRPRTADEVARATDALPVEAVSGLQRLLLSIGALSPMGSEGDVAEDVDPALAQWEFHDLLYHSRSRLGRHANAWGGAYPFVGRFDPLPPIKPAMSDDVVELYAPEAGDSGCGDSSFAEVLAGRRSVRVQGDEPLDDRQLGEFLHHSARVQQVFEDEKGGASLRPSASGGAIHELEIYPIISNCRNIAAGLYHYDPQQHRLERLAEGNPYLDGLLEMAWHSTGRSSRPQVLFVIAARFQRVQWKYRSVAYALTLKNVGGLFQTMYLVATAMGLAPCALGGGHSDIFAHAAGLNYFAETSVGEFVLGSKAAKGGEDKYGLEKESGDA